MTFEKVRIVRLLTNAQILPEVSPEPKCWGVGYNTNFLKKICPFLLFIRTHTHTHHTHTHTPHTHTHKHNIGIYRKYLLAVVYVVNSKMNFPIVKPVEVEASSILRALLADNTI